MNTKGMLDQLLQSGLGQVLGGMAGQRGTGLGQKSGLDLTRLGGQAAALGALSMLLRRAPTGRAAAAGGSGSLMRLGGLAALGMVAYKAYQEFQAKQGAAGGTTVVPGTTGGAPLQTVDRVDDQAAEAHSHAILVAMIGAAKADGRIDDDERKALEGELAREGSDAELRRWFEAEIAKPLDPAEVAKAASNEGMASEMYLATLLVLQGNGQAPLGFMEKSYLDELGRQLNLPEGLKTSLQAQARQLA